LARPIFEADYLRATFRTGFKRTVLSDQLLGHILGRENTMLLQPILNRQPILAALTILLCGSALASVANADMPRTAGGKPDLSGVYNIATLTPLQRPGRFGDKATLTPEEAADIAAYWAGNLAKDEAPSDPDRGAPPEGGAAIYVPEFEGAAGKVGGYNAFYVDIGESNFMLDGKYRTSIITQPSTGRMPKLSPQGMQKAMAMRAMYNENTGTAWWLERNVGPYDDPESRPLAERCIVGFGSTAGPPALPVMYNNLKRIVQNEDSIVIINEMNHDARVIRMNQEHLPSAMRSWLGDSIGRWEDDTLVIETTNFREESGLNFGGPELHVEERISRIDAATLRYAFTVTDPSWAEPWGGEYPWPASDEKVYEYACHEGNYSLGGILRGARLLEREAVMVQNEQSSGE
tara:strand:- start:1310 stop:2524 length:1215 start_codon:yes stop_codon:yes gene_type:complete